MTMTTPGNEETFASGRTSTRDTLPGEGGSRSAIGREGSVPISSRWAATLALPLAAAVILTACGGESGQSSAEGRISISDRGLDAAVDSARSARRRSAASAARGRTGGAARSSLPPEIQAALDSGNAAYRSGDYRAALEQFETLASEHPDVRAAWFGVFMAHRALGNAAAADSAMRRAGMGSSEAMRLHGSAVDSGGNTAPHGAMPADTTPP